MGNSNDIVQAVHGLMQQLLNSGAIWSCRSFLSDNGILPVVKAEVIHNVWATYWPAVCISPILAGIQMLKMFRDAHDQDVSYGKLLTPFLAKLIIILLLLSPVTYSYLVTYIFATPADLAAKSVSSVYFDDFFNNVDKILISFTNGIKNPIGLVKATLNGSIFATLVASLVFIVAVISLFVTSIIQSLVFLVLFYIGPFCMIFSINDWFKDIAERWIKMTLGMAWLGFIGSICFLVASTTPIMNEFSIGATANNWIVTPIYGILCLVLFWAAYPISSHLFGGGFAFSSHISGGQKMMSRGANVLGRASTKGAGSLTGKILQGAGSMISSRSKEGSLASAVGKTLYSTGSSVASASKAVSNFVFGPTVPNKSGLPNNKPAITPLKETKGADAPLVRSTDMPQPPAGSLVPKTSDTETKAS